MDRDTQSFRGLIQPNAGSFSRELGELTRNGLAEIRSAAQRIQARVERAISITNSSGVAQKKTTCMDWIEHEIPLQNYGTSFSRIPKISTPSCAKAKASEHVNSKLVSPNIAAVRTTSAVSKSPAFGTAVTKPSEMKNSMIEPQTVPSRRYGANINQLKKKNVTEILSADREAVRNLSPKTNSNSASVDLDNSDVTDLNHLTNKIGKLAVTRPEATVSVPTPVTDISSSSCSSEGYNASESNVESSEQESDLGAWPLGQENEAEADVPGEGAEAQRTSQSPAGCSPDGGHEGSRTLWFECESVLSDIEAEDAGNNHLMELIPEEEEDEDEDADAVPLNNNNNPFMGAITDEYDDAEVQAIGDEAVRYHYDVFDLNVMEEVDEDARSNDNNPNNYEITVYGENSDGESDDERRRHKIVPKWASNRDELNYQLLLHNPYLTSILSEPQFIEGEGSQGTQPFSMMDHVFPKMENPKPLFEIDLIY